MCLNSDNPESLPRSLTEAEAFQLCSRQSYYCIWWLQGVAFAPICKADISTTHLSATIDHIGHKHAEQGNRVWSVGRSPPALSSSLPASGLCTSLHTRQNSHGNRRLEIEKEKKLLIVLFSQPQEAIWSSILSFSCRRIFQLLQLNLMCSFLWEGQNKHFKILLLCGDNLWGKSHLSGMKYLLQTSKDSNFWLPDW